MNFTSPVTENASPAARSHDRQDRACIAKDTVVKGEISKCASLEVYGLIEGTVEVGHIIIHPDGKIDGTLKAGSADIHGTMQGETSITGHLAIGSDGSVTGKVLYGQLSMQEGGSLSADIKKHPDTK